MEAENARQAVARFAERPPNLVFLDITLPEGPGGASSGAGFLDFVASGTTGYEGGHKVAKAMLARDPSIKIVVCTGNPPEDPRVRELVQAGAFAVLEKPVRLGPLRATLRQVVEELEAAGGGANA